MYVLDWVGFLWHQSGEDVWDGKRSDWYHQGTESDLSIETKEQGRKKGRK